TFSQRSLCHRNRVFFAARRCFVCRLLAGSQSLLHRSHPRPPRRIKNSESKVKAGKDFTQRSQRAEHGDHREDKKLVNVPPPLGHGSGCNNRGIGIFSKFQALFSRSSSAHRRFHAIIQPAQSSVVCPSCCHRSCGHFVGPCP